MAGKDFFKIAGEMEAILSEQHSKKITAKESRSLPKIMHLISLFDRLSSEAYLLRSRHKKGLSTPIFEDRFSEISGKMIALSRDIRAKEEESITNRYRRVCRKNSALFLLIVLLFIATFFAGWLIGTEHTDYVSLFLSQGLMEAIVEKESLFDDLYEAPILGGTSIAWNNIRVCINSFLGGIILGVGGLFILCYNGVLFGVVMGFCHTHGFDTALTEFVIGHGPLELTIICSSTFAGMIYGRAFFRPPWKKFSAHLQKTGLEAGIAIMGMIPWLVLAGFVESFISPNPNLEPGHKLLIGASIGLLFWTWSFLPPTKSKTKPELKN